MMGPLPLPLPLPILCILFSVDLVTARSLPCRPCTTLSPPPPPRSLPCNAGEGWGGGGLGRGRSRSGPHPALSTLPPSPLSGTVPLTTHIPALMERRPITTVDVVLLTLQTGQLAVGLAPRTTDPFKGRSALPGGYLHVDRDQDALQA